MTASKMDFVTPLEITFALEGADVTVRPAGVAQIARMLRVAAPLIDDLLVLDPGLAERCGAGAPLAEDVVQLFTLLAQHGDAAPALVAHATGLDEAVLGRMLPDRFAYLFALVVQVNADFFARALPVFRLAGAAMGSALGRAKAPTAPTTASRSHSTP